MRTTNWLLGLVIGAFIGGLALEAGIAALLLVIPAFVWVATERSRPMGLAGGLVGIGLGGGGLLVWASVRCGSDPGCSTIDVTPWLVAAALLVGIGLALTAVGLRQAKT